jgi:hypothetical protein
MPRHDLRPSKLNSTQRAEIELRMASVRAKMSVANFSIEEWRALHVEKYALERLLLGE